MNIVTCHHVGSLHCSTHITSLLRLPVSPFDAPSLSVLVSEKDPAAARCNGCWLSTGTLTLVSQLARHRTCSDIATTLCSSKAQGNDGSRMSSRPLLSFSLRWDHKLQISMPFACSLWLESPDPPPGLNHSLDAIRVPSVCLALSC